jgi:putative DNA-invertase from lambdoid prophage Rac
LRPLVRTRSTCAGLATGSLGPFRHRPARYIAGLEHLGVGFISLTEALDLTTPAGRAMAGLLAIFAEFEREILRDRTRVGLAHARQNGKRLGRPMTAGLKETEVRKLYRTGVAKAEVARRLGIGRTSVRRILERPARRTV